MKRLLARQPRSADPAMSVKPGRLAVDWVCITRPCGRWVMRGTVWPVCH